MRIQANSTTLYTLTLCARIFHIIPHSQQYGKIEMDICHRGQCCHEVGLPAIPLGVFCQWLCKSDYFHSCCPSPVLNILLEISLKMVYVAFPVCIIFMIL